MCLKFCGVSGRFGLSSTSYQSLEIEGRCCWEAFTREAFQGRMLRLCRGKYSANILGKMANNIRSIRPVEHFWFLWIPFYLTYKINSSSLSLNVSKLAGLELGNVRNSVLEKDISENRIAVLSHFDQWMKLLFFSTLEKSWILYQIRYKVDWIY